MESELLRETAWQFVLTGLCLLLVELYLHIRLFWLQLEGTWDVFLIARVDILLLLHINIWAWIHLTAFTPTQRRKAIAVAYSWLLLVISLVVIIWQIVAWIWTAQHWPDDESLVPHEGNGKWNHLYWINYLTLIVLFLPILVLAARFVRLWFYLFCCFILIRKKPPREQPTELRDDLVKVVSAVAALDANYGDARRGDAVLQTISVQRGFGAVPKPEAVVPFHFNSTQY